MKQSVRAATTANIALLGLQVVDGVSLNAGDRVLVKNQTVAKDNGPYVVAAGAWARASDADSNAKVTPNMTLAVEVGATQTDTIWQLVTDGAIVVGVTALTFKDITDGLARLLSPIFVGSPKAPTPAQFDSSKLLATTEFVGAVGLKASAFNVIVGATVLTASHAGSTIYLGGEGNYLVKLPFADSVAAGSRLEFTGASGVQSVTVTQQRVADKIYMNANTIVGSVVLSLGDSLVLESNGVAWYVKGGSMALAYANEFKEKTRGLVARTYTASIPAAYQSFSWTRPLNSFVAPCDGFVQAIQSINIGGDAILKAPVESTITISGSVSGLSKGFDVVRAGMTVIAASKVAKGETVSVFGIVGGSSTAIIWESLGVHTSYAFIPTNT